jgi:hypothetical protein
MRAAAPLGVEHPKTLAIRAGAPPRCGAVTFERLATAVLACNEIRRSGRIRTIASMPTETEGATGANPIKARRKHRGVLERLMAPKPLTLSLLAFAACSSKPSTPNGSASSDSGPPISDSGPASPDSGSAKPDSAIDGGANTAVGYFGVELIRIDLGWPQTTIVSAGLLSAEKLQVIPLETTAREGECELRAARIPFCTEPCTGDSVCVLGGVCQRRPTQIALGEVALAGLRRLDSAPSSTLVQTSQGLTIPVEELLYPPFAEGESIHWSVAATATIRAFTIDMPAINEMSGVPTTLVVSSNMPLDVSWIPPNTAVPEGQRVIVDLDFTHHAGLRGVITCTTSDDGAMTIPASLVTGLFALGTAGFPALFVTRSVRRTITVDEAQMTFEVKSEKEVYVDVPGLNSCRTQDDCPTGQRCRDDLTCGV